MAPVAGVPVGRANEEVEDGVETGSADAETDGIAALVVVGTTIGADVGAVGGVGTGFAGAAVFMKQVHALDNLDTGMAPRLPGIR